MNFISLNSPDQKTPTNAPFLNPQVHADSSTFKADISKAEAYAQVLDEARGLIDGQRNWVCFPPSSFLCWETGIVDIGGASKTNMRFYTLDPSSTSSKPSLILGPFQGKVACQTIAFSRGVCGTAASTQTTQLVPDVEKFPGHIACDAASQSEIVVPIVVDGVVKAIIDVDCGVKEGFDEVDRKWLEELAGVLAEGCDW
ncbi:uncharacterized protein EAE97_004459 [Botrytis byssoidea]|uniref:GAF domain-containing protein n=1 Tax=Botrytis byssoidea TaxID=139641 RepID=A0A9P5M6L6_9HELO|nr:uncharacterized protein EAE97_004459 [Botrytis byssoidea]KAF7947210.1 hypothetical protein EAE97_004459 [Botrytis byssoidea]